MSLGIFINFLSGQVGIDTSTPKAALDITSSTAGLLIPRVALTSSTDNTTVTIPSGIGVEVSTLVYNDGSSTLQPAGFYYWDGTTWLQLINNEKQIYVGKFIISGTGTINVVGLPFEPKNIVFNAYSNVDAYDLNNDNEVGNNNTSLENYFGYMHGYAKNDGNTEQQVISGGASANSVNDHSRFASSNHCIGIRYASQNGDNLGLTTATITSFNANGFTLNVDNYSDELVVLFTAYKY